jgi:hypothetical protein
MFWLIKEKKESLISFFNLLTNDNWAVTAKSNGKL